METQKRKVNKFKTKQICQNLIIKKIKINKKLFQFNSQIKLKNQNILIRKIRKISKLFPPPQNKHR